MHTDLKKVVAGHLNFVQKLTCQNQTPTPQKKKKKSDTKKNVKLFFLNKSDNTFKRLTLFNGNPRKRFKGTGL